MKTLRKKMIMVLIHFAYLHKGGFLFRMLTSSFVVTPIIINYEVRALFMKKLASAKSVVHLLYHLSKGIIVIERNMLNL